MNSFAAIANSGSNYTIFNIHNRARIRIAKILMQGDDHVEQKNSYVINLFAQPIARAVINVEQTGPSEVVTKKGLKVLTLGNNYYDSLAKAQKYASQNELEILAMDKLVKARCSTSAEFCNKYNDFLFDSKGYLHSGYINNLKSYDYGLKISKLKSGYYKFEKCEATKYKITCDNLIGDSKGYQVHAINELTSDQEFYDSFSKKTHNAIRKVEYVFMATTSLVAIPMGVVFGAGVALANPGAGFAVFVGGLFASGAAFDRIDTLKNTRNDRNLSSLNLVNFNDDLKEAYIFFSSDEAIINLEDSLK